MANDKPRRRSPVYRRGFADGLATGHAECAEQIAKIQEEIQPLRDCCLQLTTFARAIANAHALKRVPKDEARRLLVSLGQPVDFEPGLSKLDES